MTGDETRHDAEEQRGRSRLSPGLHIPKNRSTGNLGHMGGDNSEKARIRFSFDAGPSATEYDTITRLARVEMCWGFVTVFGL